MLYLVKKMIGGKAKKVIMLLIWPWRNRFVLFDLKHKAIKGVNINYWADEENLGDAISPIIVQYMTEYHKKKHQSSCVENRESIRHIYAVGSIICAGIQDCTIWGSGILNSTILYRLKKRKLDIRAVRGPITQMLLVDYGFECPEVYGDPAVLMPLIYNENSLQKKFKISLVCHLNSWNNMSKEILMKEILNVKEYSSYKAEEIHIINVCTTDYKAFISDILFSELIVSSSLHGIILAEVYGVPAILLKPKGSILKYKDYYYSTKRFEFPIASNLSDLPAIVPSGIPDFSDMQKNIIDAFPYDIWCDEKNGTDK